MLLHIGFPSLIIGYLLLMLVHAPIILYIFHSGVRFRRTCLHNMHVRVMWASTAARALLAFERTAVSRKFIQQSASKLLHATCSAPCVWKAKVHGLHGLIFFIHLWQKKSRQKRVHFLLQPSNMRFSPIIEYLESDSYMSRGLIKLLFSKVKEKNVAE